MVVKAKLDSIIDVGDLPHHDKPLLQDNPISRKIDQIINMIGQLFSTAIRYHRQCSTSLCL